MAWALEAFAPTFLRRGGLPKLFTAFSGVGALYTLSLESDAAALTEYVRAVVVDKSATFDDAGGDDGLTERSARYAECVLGEARLLVRHGASVAALALWSCASGFAATADLAGYAGLTPLQLDAAARSARFPAFRPLPLAVFSATSALVFVGTGGLRFEPYAPPHLAEARAHEEKTGVSGLRSILRRGWARIAGPPPPPGS